MTCIPGSRPPSTTSLERPSVTPDPDLHGDRLAVAQDPDPLLRRRAARAAGFFVCGSGPGIRLPTMPRSDVSSLSSCCGGVKRSAPLGTSRAFGRVAVVISAVAVMPGRRLRSLLSTLRIVL